MDWLVWLILGMCSYQVVGIYTSNWLSEGDEDFLMRMIFWSCPLLYPLCWWLDRSGR